MAGKPIILPPLVQKPTPNQSSRRGTIPTLDKHGTVAGYNTLKCRCEACSAAKAEYMRRWRETHPDNSREQARRWRTANPEKKREATRRYYRAAFEAHSAIIADEAARRGGMCEEPGCVRRKGLHWHHIDPAAKRFWVAASAHHSEDSLRAELAKCELLCPLHHKARHKAMR